MTCRHYLYYDLIEEFTSFGDICNSQYFQLNVSYIEAGLHFAYVNHCFMFLYYMYKCSPTCVHFRHRYCNVEVFK